MRHPLGGLGALLAAIGLLSLPAVLWPDAVARAASMVALAGAPNPYFIGSHALLLYVAIPVIAVSSCVLFLAPGLVLALALRRGEQLGRWLLDGLALSLLVNTVAAWLIQGLAGASPRGAGFGALVFGCAVVAGGLAWWRDRRQPLPLPLGERGSAWFTAVLLLAPAAIMIALMPKFLWENFNGDGAHAFEATRLLLVQPLPFWPSTAGAVSSFPGVTSMLFAFPGSWFIRIFGELEVAARLPVLLYVMVLAGALMAVARAAGDDDGRSRPVPALPLWCAIAAYVVAMAFSATYNPYMADLALPATQDTLLMVVFLGYIDAFLRREPRWMTAYAVLTYVSLPSGMILIAFWIAAAFLTIRPRPVAALRTSVLVLVACVVLGALLPRLLPLIGLPAPGREYGVLGLLRYFAWLQITDWRRLLYVAIPSGILPALALLAWRRQDSVARALTLVTLASFALFYVQAHIALHHFVPAMLLPMAVLWRVASPAGPLAGGDDLRRWVRAAVALGIAAIVLAWPANSRPDHSGRDVGGRIAVRLDGYDRMDPAVFRHSTLLNHLFPFDWDPSVPAPAYGGSPLVWNHYAVHGATSDTTGAQYVVQSLDAAPPTGGTRIATDDGAALYVLNDTAWSRDRTLRPPTPAGSSLLSVPRGILFRSVPLTNGPPILDVVVLLERMGIDLEPFLTRVGARR